jgi:opacity protein-like surface antigen
VLTPYPVLYRISHRINLPILTLRLLLVCGVSMSSFFTTKTQGEWYVGAYGGLAKPAAFSNATLSDPTLGGGVNRARVLDLELDTSGVFGAKVGYFFEAYPWLGFETEAYTLKPDVKQQTIVGGTTSGRVFADTLSDTSLRLTPWVLNIIIRSPSISERFYPYGGMGYGLFFTSSSNLHIDNGLNIFAGARFVPRPKMALFGEYKYNSATIHFSDIRGNYSSQMFIFGVMWHFDK